jgi:dCMP deaminase
MTHWEEKISGLSNYISNWSKDRNTKVGAVIVDGEDENDIVCIGYNGFPRKVNDDIDSRHERPAKYWYTECAERNAIYSAAKKGVALKGCVIFSKRFPCPNCARGIIQSGIHKVVCYKWPDDETEHRSQEWKDAHTASEEMLTEAGIEISYL